MQFKDVHPSIRREFLLVFRDIPATGSFPSLILKAATQLDTSDRTILSALNIACGTDPARRDAILADFEKYFPEWNDKVADLVWELRPKSMMPKLGKLLDDPKLTDKQKARIVDIMAVNDDPAAGKTVLGLVAANVPSEVKQRAVENLKTFLPTKWKELAKSPELKTAYVNLLATDRPGEVLIGLKLASLAGDPSAVEDIFKAWSRTSDAAVRADAARTLGQIRDLQAVEKLKVMLLGAGYGMFDPAPSIMALGEQAGGRGDSAAAKEAMTTLQTFIDEKTALDPKSLPVCKTALEALASGRAGTLWLLKLKEDGKFPAVLAAEAGKLLRNSPFQGERNKALILFPLAAKLDKAKLPAFEVLAKTSGDAAKGKALFAASLKSDMQCMKCHKVNGEGGEIGPDLSAIGTKGSRQNLFESILYPSRAIADQHVSWVIGTADGQTITGLLVKETDTALTIRDANGKDTVVVVKNVESRKKSAVSLMSEDLVTTMTENELIDLVSYLETLKATEKK